MLVRKAENSQTMEKVSKSVLLTGSPFSKCVVEKNRNKVSLQLCGREKKKKRHNPKPRPIPLKLFRAGCCKKI